MNALRKRMRFGVFSMILCLFAAPASAVQNTWESFWVGMQTALITLESNPSQAYFDTLFDANFANRDAVFEGMEARAAALTDIEVSYPIFSFDANRAAYQKVVTGTFRQPYVFGNTNLPPTNEAVRLVWQGMLDANGDGKLTADYNVTDGFAMFQDLGAIPFGEGQEHGELGLAPFDPALVEYYRDNPEDLIGLPFAVFPNCVYNNRDLFDEAGLDYPPQSLDAPNADTEASTLLWNYDTLTEISKLLMVDVGGNDATSPDFDPQNVLQDGLGRLWFSEMPEITLNAAVHGEGWSAGYLTFTTQPRTEICVDIFEQTLIVTDSMQIPAFVFVHTNEDNEIDLVYINYDVLGITNRLQINPTTIVLARTADERRILTLTLAPLATATQGPSATPRPTATLAS